MLGGVIFKVVVVMSHYWDDLINDITDDGSDAETRDTWSHERSSGDHSVRVWSPLPQSSITLLCFIICITIVCKYLSIPISPECDWVIFLIVDTIDTVSVEIVDHDTTVLTPLNTYY